MNEANQNKPSTICGVLSDIRSIPTQTGAAFVVCKVGGHKCKVFGDLAKIIVANEGQYEGLETEAYGHWDARRGSELVIDGFGGQPAESASVVRQKAVNDTRPTKPAMEGKDNYIVITIPQGVTTDQLSRVTGAAKEAVRGLETHIGRGVFE